MKPGYEIEEDVILGKPYFIYAFNWTPINRYGGMTFRAEIDWAECGEDNYLTAIFKIKYKQ